MSANKIFEDAKKTVIERKDAVLAAIKSGKETAYTAAMADLKASVDEMNTAHRLSKYAELKTSENPMKSAVEKFFILQMRVKPIIDKESGLPTGVELVKRDAPIDLKEFTEFCDFDKTWMSDARNLLSLLTLREIDVFNVSPSKLAGKSIFFLNAVSKKKDGSTPDTNTQIVKLIQKIIDETTGTGKANNHDIAFIVTCATKLNRNAKCTIGMVSERAFQIVILNMLAHAMGEKYQVKGNTKVQKKSNS